MLLVRTIIFLYIGGSTDGLLKIDLNQAGTPVVLSAGSNIEDTFDLEVSPSGSYVHTASGQVVRADSLLQAARLNVTTDVSPGGLARYGDVADRFFTADIDRSTNLFRITVFENEMFKSLGSFNIPCSANSFSMLNDFLVVSNDSQFILFSEDRLCGVTTNFASDDSDGDGVFGVSDNCPNIANSDQLNFDGDEFGDACDLFPSDAINTDADGDSVADTSDNCPEDANQDQLNTDSDLFGDVCDAFPNDSTNGGGSVPDFSFIQTEFPAANPLHDLEYDIDRNVIYASIPSLNEVAILNTSNFNIQRRIAVGSEPRGLDLSQDRSKLYIALRGSGSIAILDLETENVTEIAVGEELDTPLAGDVEEVSPNRLFVGPNTGSSGFGFFAEVIIDDLGNLVSKRRITSTTVLVGQNDLFEASTDGNFLYTVTTRLEKLDLTQPDVPSVLTGTSAGQDLQISPNGLRLHAGSSILNTDTFTQEFSVTGTHTQYSSTGDQFFVAGVSSAGINTITIYEGDSVSEVGSFDISCNIFGNVVNDFIAIQNDEVFLTLKNNLLCGVRTSNVLADTDNDSIIDLEDNCPEISNPDQANIDGDEFGDLCDPVPNDANNLIANRLLPLEPLRTWTYMVDSSVLNTLSVLGATVNVNGVDTVGIIDSSGAIDYVTNDDEGLRRHLFVDTVGDTLTLSPPARILNARPVVGESVNNTGSAVFNVAGIGVLSVPYTYNSTVVEIETITVPFGTFEALRVDTELNIIGVSNGFLVSLQSVASDWFVEDVGIIREVDNTDGVLTTSELQSVSLPPEITSPLTGDTLTGDSVTVTFDPMGTVPTEWALRAGNTGPGSFNLAIPPNLPPTGVTSQTISGLPVDGSTFTISLYAFVNGAWTVVDSEQVTAFTAPAPAQPEITSPLTGDTLTGDSVTVTFDPMGTVPTEWALRAGNTGPGSFNLAIPPNLPPGATSQTISGLPVDGSTFTISLYAFMNGAWTVVDSEQVTAFTAPAPAQPEITSPLTGDTLTGDSVTVTFDPMGTVPTEWALRAGNTGPGSFNLAIPPNLPPGATSQTISGLPVDGSTFTISLYAFMNGAWTVVDSEQVTAFTAPAPAQPEITSPLTGDTLTGDSVTVTFDPMGTVPTEWALRAGNTGPGSFNLAIPPNLPPTGATSQTISGLPVDGSTFTISLYAFMNGAWTVVDSEQVTAFTAPAPAQPEITSPLTGDTLTGDSVTVTFDPMGTVPTEWALRAGNTGPGSFNLAIPPNLPPTGATSQTISGLPVDGSTFTISLYAFMNGAWTVVDSEQVTAFTAPAPAQPEITSPLTGDTLTGDSVTVTFDPMGTVPTEWALRAGNTGPGSFNLAIPPNLPPGATSQTISGLPVDGSTFTISLYAFINGAWTVMDSEQVTAFTAPAPAQPEITSPLTGDTLTSDSVTVTFDPMGTVPTEWALRAGNTGPGSFNLAIPPNLPPTGVTSQTISGLPVDGSTFTISLYAFIDGIWVVMDSEQVTAPNFISGVFPVSGTFNETGCQDPADNGVSLIAGTFVASAQANNVFNGTLTVSTLDGISLAANSAAVTGTYTGTHAQINANGNYILDAFVQNALIAQNQGTYTATLVGDTITVTMAGADTIGDTCSLTGTLSGSR